MSTRPCRASCTATPTACSSWSPRCARMYCRHCTRRRTTGEEDYMLGEAEINEAIRYIEAPQQIRDVWCPAATRWCSATRSSSASSRRVRAIEHVEIIRIGTRVPVVCPAHHPGAAVDAQEVPADLDLTPTSTTRRSSRPRAGRRATAWPTPASRWATRACCCAASTTTPA